MTNQPRKINEDFVEEKFFDDDEAQENARGEDDEIDPLDLYMQEVGHQLQKDLRTTRQQVETYENEDPVDTQYQSLKNKLIKAKNKQQKGQVQKQIEDDIDPDDYAFLDSDGDVDFDELGKKKKIDPLAPVDHNTIKYEPFDKNFYEEHEEITKLTQQQVDKIRKEYQIKCKGEAVPRPIISFAHLGFDDTLMNKISAQKFEKPTAIQAQALPCVMQGRDVIGVAKTGSGKTVAYVWPLLIHVLDQREVERKEGPIGLILLPTRELGQQVYLEMKKYANLYGIKVCAILGGENKRQQWKDLINGMDIVIATPGRLIEMIKKRATNLRRCTYLVLDEADNMFTMGFEYQIRSIINNIRPDRQTLLFTATMKKKVQYLCIDILNDPIIITIGDQEKAVNEDIKQIPVLVENDEDRTKWLLKNLSQFINRGKVLIFVNQIIHCENLAREVITKTGIDVLTLHGDKLQQERTTIINAFKTTKHCMIATDVASRGLDIKDIRTVINYYAPKDADVYIHRIGRTGRAGNLDGVAYTLVQKDDWKLAILLIKSLEMVGQAVPQELEEVAMIDDKFRIDRTKKKMGLEYAKGKDASKMLKQALKRQRNSSNKAGLGYQETEEEKKAAIMKKQQERKSFLADEPQKKVQLVPFQGSFDTSQPSQFEGKFEPLNPLKHDFKMYAQSVGLNAAQSREEVLQHYQSQMRSTFRSSFISAGEIVQDQKGPKVSYLQQEKKE